MDVNLSAELREKEKSNQIKDLKFTASVTNPILFLAEFDKCFSASNEQEKTHEFNQFCYTNSWLVVRKAFIKTFALKFIKNKKNDINIELRKEPNLRSFVDRKLCAFEKYTTLTFTNQMEMILNDLPIETAKIFFVNGKLECSKTEILDFCDSIQGENIDKTSDFNYDSDAVLDSESIQPMLSDQLSEPDLVLPYDVSNDSLLERSNERKLTSQGTEAMEIEILDNVPKERFIKSSRAGRGRGRGIGRAFCNNTMILVLDDAFISQEMASHAPFGESARLMNDEYND
ncbi:hypothetical protein Bhyg_12555 [Pseudolycoriella hygida]|uniref:Uncharacterized protein n=1 Tax=Pseudolycoriella hygida TaxID=35572 RepID=A0A9Q0S1B2_9DIPT|nr:hypothetical protein Bhyg_12555 [Pseudolycoriella hygida]